MALIFNNKMLFPKLDNYFAKRQDLFFYISFAILFIFNIMLFDVRISIGGDDSGYLVSAKKFIEREAFPTYHGAFYSILIGWFIKLIGFNLVFFKALSFLFLLGHQTFLYYGLKKHVSPFILSATLIISSICSGLIYFGSQTYTEAFFLFLQGLFFITFLKYLYNRPNTLQDIRESWLMYIALGATMFMLATTRNVGMVSVLTVVLFFLLEKRFYQATYTFLSYLLFSIPYSLYKKMAWSIEKSDMSGQMQLMMQKHPYNKALGTEDLSGLFTRVVENMKNYLSRVLLHETGLKDLENKETSLFIAILVVIVLVVGLILAFRYKNRVMKFLLLYLGSSLGVTFIALHQMWSQARLIIVYIPIIIITVSWTLAQLATNKKLTFLRLIVVVLLTFITFKSFTITAKKAKDHQEVLSKNLSGNKYYGYTPDWVNFLKMSEWVSKKIDKNVMVGSRKPSMSFIYGNGREFFPIYRLPVEFSDSIMAQVDSSAMLAYFIKESNFRNKPAKFVYRLKNEMTAGISADNVLYGVYLIDNRLEDEIDHNFKNMGIDVIKSGEKFRTLVLDKAKQTTAIVPDVLVNRLLDNNVQYIIVGNLRVNPKQKTDRTINTVARYVAGIQIKYPGIAVQVHQIGRNEKEPARLYKIEYSKYGL